MGAHQGGNHPPRLHRDRRPPRQQRRLPWFYFKDGNGENLRIPKLPGVVDYFTNSLEYYDQSLSTAVFQHLGSFFKQRLRTSLGLSRDHWKQTRNLPTQLIGVFQETRFVDAAGQPLPDDADDIPVRLNADTRRTNKTAGAVFNLTQWLAVTASYQESAMFTDNVGTDLYGNARQPTSGSGIDFGLRFAFLNGRVNANVIRYDNTAENYATNIGAALQTEVNDALNTTRTTLSPDLILGTSDSNNRTTEGWELELTANITRNWTTRLALATTQDHRSTSVPQFRAKVEAARSYLASIGRSATEIDAALSGSLDYLDGQNDENRQPKRYRGVSSPAMISVRVCSRASAWADRCVGRAAPCAIPAASSSPGCWSSRSGKTPMNACSARSSNIRESSAG